MQISITEVGSFTTSPPFLLQEVILFFDTIPHRLPMVRL